MLFFPSRTPTAATRVGGVAFILIALHLCQEQQYELAAEGSLIQTTEIF